MQVETAPFDVGIIVGRFQVHELHEGHKDLIRHVMANHDKVIIILGTSPLWVTTNNPLDFQARRQMISEHFPDVEFAYVKDVHNDALWSTHLDKIVGDLCNPGQTVVLYGSRDSFIRHYTGKLPTRVLEAERVFSGTQVRKKVKGAATRATPDFRAGVIHATGARFPTVYTTVDIAILSEDSQKILLGRKEGEEKYRFVGGFADPRSASFEDDAIRETMEETGLTIYRHNLEYIGSTDIQDWRYSGEPDCVRTLLWFSQHTQGQARADDDLAEVRWFDMAGFDPVDTLMELHIPLFDMLDDYLGGI